jgi:hypothetical protein
LVRSWLVIPAMGTIAAAAAFGLGGGPWDAACGAAAGAALAHAIRTLAGDSPAALAGAGLASLLAIALIVERGGELALPWLAIAAAAWTFAELARPTRSPLVAMVPATLAAILEPGCAALIAIAGTRLVTAPWQRPRWAIATSPHCGIARRGTRRRAPHCRCSATRSGRWLELPHSRDSRSSHAFGSRTSRSVRAWSARCSSIYVPVRPGRRRSGSRLCVPGSRSAASRA